MFENRIANSCAQQSVGQGVSTQPRNPNTGVASETGILEDSIQRCGEAVAGLMKLIEEGGATLSVPDMAGANQAAAPDEARCSAAERIRAARRTIDSITNGVRAFSRRVDL
jgi:hypothetical protein